MTRYFRVVEDSEDDGCPEDHLRPESILEVKDGSSEVCVSLDGLSGKIYPRENKQELIKDISSALGCKPSNVRILRAPEPSAFELKYL